MDQKIQLLSSSCVYGIAIGSIISGSLRRYGKRRIVICFETIGIIGSVMSSIKLDYNMICTGRFIYGLCGGALLSTCPSIVEETVPFDLIDKGYGASSSIAVQSMIFFCMLMGFLVPVDQIGLANTQVWRIIYLFPIPFLIIGLYCNLIFL